jgi:hypothetical protein
MLTLKDMGKPIAIVHGGYDDGEIISIINENEAGGNNYSDDEYSDEEEEFEQFEPQGGMIVPLPSMDSRQVTYIAGPSGAGKSSFAAMQAQKYRKIYPQNKIYMFSRLDTDPAFDGKFQPPIIRMKIDDSLVTRPIDITKQIQGGALIIFDDIDCVLDDKLKKAVIKLENDCLEIGRHNNIHIIACSHLINGNDKKLSRTLLNESHMIVVFPKSGSTYQIDYMLKNYFGLSKQKIQEILNLPSRWVALNKGYPQYVCHEKGCFLL